MYATFLYARGSLAVKRQLEVKIQWFGCQQIDLLPLEIRRLFISGNIRKIARFRDESAS